MAITIGFPLYESFDSLDVLGPYQAFNYASGMSPSLVAETMEGVKSLEGVTILPTARFGECGQFDIPFVPGGSNLEKVLERGPLDKNPYLDFLTEQAKHAKWVCSVCTGALLLGAAGLLKGCVCTTHWAYKDVLRLFPCEVVDDYRRYVQSGNRITGGGISSGLDEALYIISVIQGIETARRAQLSMQYNPQPPVHCGDPAQPDMRDNPRLADQIRSDWDVADTYAAFQRWLGHP